jgi:hypothetical protein
MIDHLSIVAQIKANATYKQILADSFGGIMYNVANRDKYNEGKGELLALYAQVKDRDVLDGIVKGAMHFLEGNY